MKGWTLEKEQSIANESKETSYKAPGLSFGLSPGEGVGVVLSAPFDSMAFMSIGIGAELAIGIDIGSALDQRNRENGQ